MLVHVDCLCGKERKANIVFQGLTSIYSSHRWDVVECANCGNGITIPVPGKKLLEEIYSQNYFYNVHFLASGEKKFRSQIFSKFLKKLLPQDKAKKIFEIGCMHGFLLNELKNDYFVKGIEIGDDAVNYCKNLGLNVSDVSIENYLSQNSETFDLIILLHVFEHLLNPVWIITQLRDRLNENGKLVISVPNSASFFKKLFGRNWGWWQVPVHINHFKESAMHKLADNNGMKIEKVRYKGGDSLMILLNFINLFNFRSKKSRPGLLHTFVIKFFSFFLRYWYFLGNEELTVVLTKK